MEKHEAIEILRKYWEGHNNGQIKKEDVSLDYQELLLEAQYSLRSEEEKQLERERCEELAAEGRRRHNARMDCPNFLSEIINRED